jgi:carboxylesterase type B
MVWFHGGAFSYGRPIRHGRPWPAYMAADRATMTIESEWRLQNDPQHEARLL